MSYPNHQPIRPRLVRCPNCKKETEYSLDNQWRPFCCQRCYNIDLGVWATDGYRIASEEEGMNELQDDELH